MAAGDPIRVGLIGASTDRHGWAVIAHAPALAALEGFTLHAVATSRRESAQRSATALGAPVAHVGAAALIADEDVDLVVVAVNVRGHAEIVREALAAGANVLCEWPLGIEAAESRELAEVARTSPGLSAIGLQARWAPAVQKARRLIAGGYLGRPLSASLIISDPILGAAHLPPVAEYTIDRDNGVTILTVPGCHALDPLCLLAGDITELSARLDTRTPAAVSESGERLTRTSEDHAALLGTTREGISVVAHLQSGSAPAPHSVLEMRGEEGVLRIQNGTPAQLQMSSLTLSGTRESRGPLTPIVLAGAEMASVPATLRGTPAENVAALYASIGAALRDGRAYAGDFGLAAARHRLAEASVESSNNQSRRVAI